MVYPMFAGLHSAQVLAMTRMAGVVELGGVGRRALMTVTAVASVLVAVGCAGQPTSGPAPRTVTSEVRFVGDGISNPLAEMPFYVDPTTSAAIAASRAVPRKPELDLIAGTPQAWWVDQQTPIDQVAEAAHRYMSAAAAAHSMPIVAVYGIPARDCGGFAAGGLASGDQYRRWIAELARGLGTSPVAIIVEPDGLTSADCLAPPQRQERMELLRFAVETLAGNPSAAVYIDGGHSRWLSPEELAGRLNAVGIDKARGFSLNVSNFFTTAEEANYAEQVSQLTNGSHYVIDTSRNGNGPAPDEPLNWCNPPGRALGQAPTPDTGYEHADAYLWIKHPGESDGECDRGDPHSGTFMVAYAVDLVRARAS